jgi:L-fucose mutarotase
VQQPPGSHSGDNFARPSPVLKGINPLLRGDLLKVLDEMGHGDQLMLVDRNYPSYASGKPVIAVASKSILEVSQAILEVFPIDTFIEYPLERMEVDQDPNKTTPVQDELLEQVRVVHRVDLEFGVIPRMEVYERAKSVFAVVHTLEAAPYCVFLLHKGVIA